jgi:hypothetical protein
VGDPARLPAPRAALPHPRHRRRPAGRRPLPGGLLADPAHRHLPARAGAAQSAAPDAARGHGRHQLRDLRHELRGRGGYRAVIIGFPVFATLIILGAWWASIAWGRYWGWDPKETSALATWLIYAAYLHARSLRGWSGRPAALLLVVGFGAVLFTFFGNLFFSGLHAYSGL